LIPEIWSAVAEATGIPELRRTTRDEPDYDLLMRQRLAILDQHGLTMSAIETVISTLQPLPGAVDFLNALREQTQVIILSDTFEQFGRPFMRQLGMPTLFCHRLIVEDDRIVDFELRQVDQKRHAVEAFRSLNFRNFGQSTILRLCSWQFRRAFNCINTWCRRSLVITKFHCAHFLYVTTKNLRSQRSCLSPEW
jgi:phosphoserine/homoserine phosphotransferase